MVHTPCVAIHTYSYVTDCETAAADDLLQAESPNSLLAEASSRELDVLSDCESDEDYGEESP